MQNFKFKIQNFLLVFGLWLFVATSASAHVVVKPTQVGVGERVNFAVSVPTEEDTPTTQLRLVLPEGLSSVRPNAKQGWNIQLVKTGTGEDAKITEIIWSGGRVPTEQRDDFGFSAQAPATESTLVWKAYQTYGDGDIVAWETDPKVVADYSKANPPAEGEDDHNAPRPWSETKVINDLGKTPAVTSSQTKSDKGSSLPLMLSTVAILLAAFSIGLQLRKK